MTIWTKQEVNQPISEKVAAFKKKSVKKVLWEQMHAGKHFHCYVILTAQND